MNQFCRKANNYRNRPGLPPKSRQHTNKKKGDEDIIHGFHTADRKSPYLPQRISFINAINGKYQPACQQCPNNGYIKQQANQQCQAKQHNGNVFHNQILQTTIISIIVSIIVPTYHIIYTISFYRKFINRRTKLCTPILHSIKFSKIPLNS